jgi:regulator of replication initiation timing
MDVTTTKDGLDVLEKRATGRSGAKPAELEVLLAAVRQENKNLRIENHALRQRLELLEEAAGAGAAGVSE